MEHLLYRELLKREQHLMWTEAIFLAIINIFLWPSLGTFLFPTPVHRPETSFARQYYVCYSTG